MIRCDWSTNNELMINYHDTEWGVPVHDDQMLFEHLSLDCFQAGLSWQTILNKRENFRAAFDNFQIHKVASYDQKKVHKLLSDAGIIRNRLKIEAVIHNAKRVLEIQKTIGSFNSYIWSFTDGKTIHNHFQSISEIPPTSNLSDQISKDMRHKGFTFCGATIIYAFLQAIGVVNDHVISCFRYKELISV
jgi:DNA-3-methyladenine glycosylase I